VYNPPDADGWKAAVAAVAAQHLPAKPIEGPIRLTLAFVLPMPAKGGEANHWHIKRPDIDNLAKAVMDTLTRCRMWQDDGQVCDLRVSKCYGIRPQCSVLIAADI
jgi:Holliday junction resolvase RusA-like endonuclease